MAGRLPRAFGLVAALVLICCATLLAGARPAAAVPAPEPGPVVGGAISRSEVITRAHAWYQLRNSITYDQSRCYLTGVGSTGTNWSRIGGGCFPSYYRQDCSGFVSMALNLPQSLLAGERGKELARTDVAQPIGWQDLKPGDYLLHFSGNADERHTRLFDRWANAEHTRYWTYDFGSHPVQHVQASVNPSWFEPYRYRKIVDDPGGATVYYQEPGTQLPPGVHASMVRDTDFRIPVTRSEGGEDGDGYFTTWGDTLNVRRDATTSSAVVNTIAGGTRVRVACQAHGQNITADGITNDAWSYLPDHGGWITNIYLQGPAWMPGVPTCSGTRPGSWPTFTTWGDTLNVRQGTTTSSSVVNTIAGGTQVRVACQAHGQNITADGITNDAWSYLPDHGGWITNIYLQGPAWMPGVPTCA
ncbi:hypothetical protein ACWCQL_35595 [Streptomyces sp. NPDC002073]